MYLHRTLIHIFYCILYSTKKEKAKIKIKIKNCYKLQFSVETEKGCLVEEDEEELTKEMSPFA